jgi:hypothetical protein
MPTMTLGNLPIRPLDYDRISFRFAFTMKDSDVVYAFVSQKRFDKHVSAFKDGPAIEPVGDKHTAIAPASIGAIRPLYEFFARDAIYKFRDALKQEAYVNLEYKKEELPATSNYDPNDSPGGNSSVSHGINVYDPSKPHPFHTLVVGCVVKNLAAGEVKNQSAWTDRIETGTIPIVYFDHGPFVKN